MSGLLLVPAEAGDHAIGGARVLDLEHRRACRADTSPSSGFAITPSRPAPSKRCSHSAATRAIARHRRQVDRRRDVREQLFERVTPLALRPIHDRLAIDGQQIEADERRRHHLRELLDARRRRMQPQLQRIEIQGAVLRDHDLAVDDAARRQALEQGVVQLRKIAIERLQIAALDVDVVRRCGRRSSESRPTWVRTAGRRLWGWRRRAWRAWARWAVQSQAIRLSG